MTAAVVQLLAGLVLLSVAADRFVDAAAHVSRLLGVPAIVVGAVVLGIGTSLPEATVTTLAALSGEGAMGLGNAVGSNVTNVTLVLGAAALLAPLETQRRLLRREGAIAWVACGLLAAALLDGSVAPAEGLGLFVAGVVAAVALARFARGAPEIGPSPAPVPPERTGAPPPPRLRLVARDATLAIVSLAGVLAGAHLLVRGATATALLLGASQEAVGLTILAAGTSLPELAASVAAARRGHAELVLGNVLGSNLFNATFVAATAPLAGAVSVGASTRASALAMMAAATLAGVFAWSARRISRPEGALLLTAFATFVAFVAATP